MNCRYCHDGDDMDRLRARIQALEKVAKLGRDIIHDHLTHEDQETIADDLKEIDEAIRPTCGDVSPSFKKCPKERGHDGPHGDGVTCWADAGGFAY